MFSYFKIKIILWYSFLLTVILATTLFGSYKFMGFQLKNEILSDLELKTNSVESILNEGMPLEKESGEEHQGERDRDIHERRDYNLYDLQLFTEIADDNYILFIYKDGKLNYLTEKYRNEGQEISPFNITNKQIKDISINDRPFSITALHKAGHTVFIGYELSVLSGLQDKMLKIFLIAFPVGVILSVICGFVVTQRSMKVINKISLTTNRITSQNLNERIEAPQGKDEISKLIDTLNSMIDRLEKSFIQAKQLSQDTAHEIRTPLTIIRSEIEELVESETTNDATAQKLENILEEVQYLSSMSNKLLLMHIMDTTKLKYAFEAIDLSGLLKEIYQDALVIASDRKLDITSNITDNIQIKGNRELLIRLLWNITDNAIKYNKPKGSINFQIYKDNLYTCIEVKDSGIGISTEEIPKIFDRFYRVDKSRSRELRGSGLGLSISKWITDLHNALISVESEVGKGSVFKITFTA